MSWFPVRMRQPQTIIGFIFVPDEIARTRRVWVLPVREPVMTKPWAGDSMPYPQITSSAISIRITRDDPGQETYIDAEDLPLDTWRRVAGFLEVMQERLAPRMTTSSTTVTLPKTENKPQPTVRKRKRLELDL